MTIRPDFTRGIDRALELDRADPLASFRDEFHIPGRSDGKDEIYLAGNSLGLQPKRTAAHIEQELSDWRHLAVKGHLEARSPWLPYHEFLAEPMAAIVGGLPVEVVTMNSLTANLHFLLVSFYRPTASRHRILMEDRAFPSDHYAATSQILFHGYDPAASLLLVRPREGEEAIRRDDLLELIEREGESIALILLPGVQYYTGQAFDMEAIAAAGRAKGCVIGFDLAHAAGNLLVRLHDWNVDFACWCTYKYLNSGPGSTGGAFVHERHAKRFDLPRFGGWWGHDKSTRFLMGPEFRPMAGAEGWQVSNPPILSLAAIRASLEVFTEAGGMEPLREKSARLTGYLEQLLRSMPGGSVSILTPSNSEERGCQLSLTVGHPERSGREVFERLEAGGVACDWREPNVIRVAPAPLYNSFTDVYRFADILGRELGLHDTR
ncbi:MAG TPA: kynureninase [Thermoanaerobaculia bacterium]|nr:kynureninase [Thermoanaerobaculia bacterium]